MGYTIDGIVETLKTGHPEVRISHGTVVNDLQTKYREIRDNFRSYIDDLPQQHRLAITGLDKIQYEAWRIFERATESRTKLAALSVIQDAIMSKQACLGDPEQITQAIKTIARLRNQLELKEVMA